MASLARPWLPTVLYITILFQVPTYSTASIHASSVEVGYLWENPRQENHHSAEVVISTIHLKSKLRLICFLSPPLPGKYENQKNKIVKWEKVTGNHSQSLGGIRFWDDGLKMMAMSLDNITGDVIGTYRCSYGQLFNSITVKVANIEIMKTLISLQTQNALIIKKSLLESQGKSLTCKSKSVKATNTTTNIHKLRPQDVRVVAALGDGFTSGFGAKASSWSGFFNDYRGISWSIGGEGNLSSTTTLPNILKQFSPKLTGFSTDTSRMDFNKAKANSTSGDLTDQVSELIKAMKSSKAIDFENDWKVLTIWTGTVDICHSCQNAEKYNSDKFIQSIMHSLNTLKKEIPKLYVNLVPPMDVGVLNNLFAKKPICQILKQKACPCASNSRTTITKTAQKYMRLLEKLVNSGIYEQTDQFTVVLQPFIVNGPKDKSGRFADELFGPDCFHFNTKGHDAAAIALWNSMLQPLPSKKTEWNINQQIRCPNQMYQYLTTKANSNDVVLSDDDNDSASMPPAAAITLSVFLTVTVLAVTIIVWRTRKSRPRNDTMRLLAYPHRPRL